MGEPVPDLGNLIYDSLRLNPKPGSRLASSLIWLCTSSDIRILKLTFTLIAPSKLKKSSITPSDLPNNLCSPSLTIYGSTFTRFVPPRADGFLPALSSCKAPPLRA